MMQSMNLKVKDKNTWFKKELPAFLFIWLYIYQLFSQFVTTTTFLYNKGLYVIDQDDVVYTFEVQEKKATLFA